MHNNNKDNMWPRIQIFVGENVGVKKYSQVLQIGKF